VLVATDIHRLIKIKVSQIRIEKPLSFVLAKRTIMLLIKILCDDKIIKADFDNKYIRITMNDIVFISTFILDKQYPDYETAIPKNNKNILIVNRESLLWTLKRLILFTNALTYQITLSISEKELKIMADDVNFAHKAEETLPCTYDGENGIMILYNVKYLLDILQNLNSENVIMKLAPIGDNKYSQKASIIMPEKNDEQIILLMPMRP
jgi:DNA polymerase-3 subunit beta